MAISEKHAGKNLLLVQIVNRNLGDAVIADNTDYLLRQIGKKTKKQDFTVLRYDITSEDLLPIASADAVIFAGGGLLKFRQEHFDEAVIQVLEAAERYRVPVFFNAVGVEGYDEENPRCSALEQALHLSCVKGISCRDDIVTLRQDYLPDTSIPLYEVPDVAVLSGKAYRHLPSVDSRNRDSRNQDSRNQASRLNYPVSRSGRPLIGLGITREDLFSDYGTENITKELQLAFWKELAQLLWDNQFDICIFTNGLPTDEAFAEEVFRELPFGRKAPAPVEPWQLVQAVRSFDGMVAGRMHSNIVAFSYGIPSIGLLWNDKLSFWGKKIGHPERMISPSNMQAEFVFAALQKALKEGVFPLSAEETDTLQYALSEFLEKEVFAADSAMASTDVSVDVSAAESIHYQSCLVAKSLGGKAERYTGLNTPESISESFKEGFRFLETEVRLSADGTLVCVDGWNQKTTLRLGLSPSGDTSAPQEALSKEAFLQCSYYGLYPTATLREVVKKFRKKLFFPAYADAKLILDIGKPETGEAQDLFFRRLWESFQMDHGGPFLSSRHIMVLLRR
ncbi:MAG TPA: polysaccharide pyruvyl transferase family protein, partial [Clostridiales bacterium]|nr:polysaccharide pyruvyl transferase family protein [Clostridiales bacterium]